MNYETFLKVKTHLLTQNKKSHDVGEGCVYRNSEGLKCAVGCLIPDEDYAANMEFKGVDNLQHRGLLKGMDTYMLRELQLIHDLNPPSMWKEKLDTFELEHFNEVTNS